MLSQLQSDLEAGSVDEIGLQNVEKFTFICARSVETLRMLLQRVSPQDVDSKRIQTGKFLLSIAKAKKVSALETRITKEKNDLHFALQNVTKYITDTYSWL